MQTPACEYPVVLTIAVLSSTRRACRSAPPRFSSRLPPPLARSRGVPVPRCRCNFIESYKAFGADAKIVYRHYATLYFCFVVDRAESELGILDLIQVRRGGQRRAT